jgi:uncharacterized protein with HEPN domain
MPPERPGSAWRDSALLLDMKLAAEDAVRFVDDLDEAAFLASDLHQSAVIRKLEVIGEAAGKVSPGFRAAHPEVAWREITGLRHRLVHGYGDVRLDIVWRVVKNLAPQLIFILSALVPRNSESNEG